MRCFGLFMMVLAVLAVVPGGAFAQVMGMNLTNIAELERPAFMPQEEFEAKTEVVTQKPYGDDNLGFSIRLPKDWLEVTEAPQDKPRNGGLSDYLTGELVRYASPARLSRRNFFTVEAQELSYEIGARNWFLNYILSTSFTLTSIGKESTDRREIEAMYVELQGDITYAVRVKTVINGPRVIVARYYVPSELYEEDKVMQAQSLNSFRLTGKIQEIIEPRATHGFLSQAYFDYPQSWKLNAPNVVNIDRMRAMVYTRGPGGRLSGQINIYITSRYIEATLAEEVKMFRETLDVPEYTLGEKRGEEILPTRPDVEFAQTDIYRLNPTKKFMSPYELWATVMQTEGYFYIVSLVTPAREADFYQWARNARAYEVVVGSIRQFDNSIDQYKYNSDEVKLHDWE